VPARPLNVHRASPLHHSEPRRKLEDGQLIDSKDIMSAFFLQGNAKALANIARSEKDPELRKTAVETLSLMSTKESTEFMLELLKK
jgi:HEAT repeat protein